MLDGIEQPGTVFRPRKRHLKYLEDEYPFGEVFGVITVNMRELEQNFILIAIKAGKSTMLNMMPPAPVPAPSATAIFGTGQTTLWLLDRQLPVPEYVGPAG